MFFFGLFQKKKSRETQLAIKSGAASLAPSFQDAQLDQGQKLLKRMRFERKLLRYCQRKAGGRRNFLRGNRCIDSFLLGGGQTMYATHSFTISQVSPAMKLHMAFRFIFFFFVD